MALPWRAALTNQPIAWALSWATRSGHVAKAEADVRVRVALFGGFAKPLHRLGCVHRQARANRISKRQPSLGGGFALVGLKLRCFSRLVGQQCHAGGTYKP